MISVIYDLIHLNFFCYYKIQILKWTMGMFADQRNKTYCNTIKKKHVQDIPRAPDLCSAYSRYCSLYFIHMSSYICDQVLFITVYMCNFHHQTIPAITNTALLSVVINFNFTGENQENNAPLFLNQQCPSSWSILRRAAKDLLWWWMKQSQCIPTRPPRVTFQKTASSNK